ncbi:MAG: VOC family protein [Vulcanimicrobiaceae bacterium]
MELEPYLFFSGNCEEALTFYAAVFGGEITAMMRVGDTPMAAQMPPESHKNIMHANFKSPELRFMASDASPGKSYGEGPISLSLGMRDVAEAQRIFNRLAEGGNVDQPLEDMFWGAKFGMLTDRYGIDWMINCETKQP